MPYLRPALFLDRDGTINADVDYLHDPEQLHLLPQAGPALFRLQRYFVPVVVTNQSGIARGLLDEPTLARIHQRLDEMLLPFGVKIAKYYYCPHHPDFGGPAYRQDCQCRKPKTLLFRRAAQELGLDLTASWAVGDRWRDCQGPLELGCHALLLGGDSAANQALAAQHEALQFAPSWEEAVGIILKHT